MTPIIAGSSALVTGGGGFIGANLIKKLLQQNVTVHAIVKKSSDLWRITENLSRISLHYVELTDSTNLKKLLHQIHPDYIFHLATHGAYPNQTDASHMITVNIHGTYNILEACNDIPYRLFVQTGTSSEYGYKQKPMKESDVLHPTSFYAATKASATLLGSVFAKTYHKPIVSLRLFSVYGPYEEPARFIPTCIKALVMNEKIRLTPGKQRRDFIYIDDVIRVFLKLMKKRTHTPGDIFNVGTGHEYTNDQIVKALFSIAQKKTGVQKGAYPPRTWDTKHWRANIAKISNDLSWTPKYSLDEGLEKTYTWWCNYYENKK